MKRGTLPKFLLSIVLTAFIAVSSLVIVACKKPTEYSITWELTNATVTVEGHSTAPTKAEDGTEIRFSVTPTTGYKVASVKFNDAPLTQDSKGAYSFQLSVNTKVVVVAEKELVSVEVATKPTKLTYFAGEALNRTGMVVKANYATGDSVNIGEH